MLNETFLVNLLAELGIWFVLVIIAKKANSTKLNSACDVCLVFILSGHSWKAALYASVLSFLLRKTWEWVKEFSLDVLFPELRTALRAFLSKRLAP